MSRNPLKRLLTWTVPLLLLALLATAMTGRVWSELRAEAPAMTAQDHGQGKADPAQADESKEHKIDGAKVFNSLYGHVTAHEVAVIDLGDTKVTVYDITLWQVGAVLLIFVLFFFFVRRPLEGAADGKRMGWLGRVFSGFVMYIRDEMVMPIMGEKDGRAFLPFFLFVFFFIMFMNVLGLLPHSKTPTATITVTGAMAVVVLVVMLVSGMKAQGAKQFWIGLVPHGVPSWLVPLLFLVEVIGLVVKPFALMIRLFANMLAGHLVVLSFMGLILLFAPQIQNWAYAIAVPSVGLAVFIMIIEGFVALLQAYIFTYLSILFINMCRHPDH